MIEDPWFYAAAIPAVMLVGLSKGGFAGGISLLAVPLLALYMSPIRAAGIMLPIMLAMDVVSVWAYRRHWDAANLKVLIPSGTAGVAAGWLAAAVVTDAHVRLLVGIIALAFALNYWIGAAARQATAGANWPRGTVAGIASGFTSFICHTGGPPYQMYMLPQRLDRRIFAGTAVMFFGYLNVIKVVPFFFLGQFSAENLGTSLVLLPLGPLATLAGVWLVRLVSQDLFYRITYAAVLVVSLRLIWDGLKGMGWL